MQTIALFGASGQTGKFFLPKALEQYKVRAMVRNPDKISIQHSNLYLIKGDVSNQDDVSKTISHSDAVVSLLGHVKDSPEDLLVKAFQYIIDAMHQCNITRIITLTGGGVRDHDHDKPGFIDKMIVWGMENVTGKKTRNVLVDGRRSAVLLQKSGLDWTIVRGPVLTNKSGTGHVEAGHVGKIPGFMLSRDDLADFILEEIENNEFIHQMPFLTNG